MRELRLNYEVKLTRDKNCYPALVSADFKNVIPRRARRIFIVRVSCTIMRLFPVILQPERRHPDANSARGAFRMRVL